MTTAPVSQFMSTDVACVGMNAPLTDVTSQMHQARYSCVVITDGPRPVGVITERDLTAVCDRLLNREAAGGVAGIMSDGIITLPETATCDEAVALLHQHRIRRLVIVDGQGRLAGVLTQTDLLRAHAQELESQRALLEIRVAERTRELEALNRRLEGLARIDPMLGIGNRRAMDEALTRHVQRAQRYDNGYCLVLIDVDFFKKYNDHYGHQAGDEALTQVAAAIQGSIRASDELYRYGGEEFLLLLPEVGPHGAMRAAEHVLEAVRNAHIEHMLSPFGHVTVSIGVAEENIDSPDSQHTIHMADAALYNAKAGGRNCVSNDTRDAEGAAA